MQWQHAAMKAEIEMKNKRSPDSQSKRADTLPVNNVEDGHYGEFDLHVCFLLHFVWLPTTFFVGSYSHQMIYKAADKQV